MKKVIFILFLATSALFSQNVYFCESYTEQGVPIDASVNVKIKPGGGNIYILLDNAGKPIHDDMIYLFIDKMVNGKFEPHDSKPIDIREGRTWAVFDYGFKEEGEYKANFVNTRNQLIATGNYIDGMRDGDWKFYSGEYIAEGSYIDGFEEGEWKGYFANGKLAFEGSFRDGFENGEHVYYYDSGRVKEIRNYKLGIRDGDWKSYDVTGELILTTTYVAGQETKFDGTKLPVTPGN